jgi:peptidoglycan/xylan/chitin deacetylase (PgdA/CDA1 family)
MERRISLRLPAMVLTFDDCYKTQFSNAVPALVKAGYPATFFAVTQRIGKDSNWGDSTGPPGLPLMEHHELLRLRRLGFDIGCHGRTHANLSELAPQAQKSEIQIAKAELEKLFHEEVQFYCYPYGRYTADVIEITRRCGFLAAASVRVGAVRPKDDPFALKRVCVPFEATREELRSQFTWIPQLAEIVRAVPYLDQLARLLWRPS